MVSPPPSSPTPAAAPPAEPPPSTVTDGAVSGMLPAAEAFAVHYPGYPSSPALAARTLGGLPAIAKVRSSGLGARLELRFRPEDPYCHPAFGKSRASVGLVLRLFRRKGAVEQRVEVVARVQIAYHFEGRLEIDDGDVMMLVPPLFSVKDRPTKIALLESSKASSKSMHRGVVQQQWEMDIEAALKHPFSIQAVPGKINWEDHVPKNSVEWDCQMAVCKLFDERPVWPKQSLYERLQDNSKGFCSELDTTTLLDPS